MKINCPIWLLAYVTFMTGCSDSDSSRKEDSTSQPPTKSVNSQKPASIPSEPNLEPLQNMQTQEPETIEHLAKKVQGERVGPNGRAAIVAMHELLKQWSPVGKTTSQVKQMLGKPSEADQEKLIYRFDDGDQSYEWTMRKTNDAIASISKMLYE